MQTTSAPTRADIHTTEIPQDVLLSRLATRVKCGYTHADDFSGALLVQKKSTARLPVRRASRKAKKNPVLLRQVARFLEAALPGDHPDVTWFGLKAETSSEREMKLRAELGMPFGLPHFFIIVRGLTVAIHIRCEGDPRIGLHREMRALALKRAGASVHEAGSVDQVAAILLGHGVRLAQNATAAA